MSEPDRPVFVDPSGRRRQLVRVLAVSGAVLVGGWLMLVLIAAVGGPDSPAAKLPLLPEHPLVANPGSAGEMSTVAPTVTLTVAPTNGTEPSTPGNQPPRTTASAPPVAPPPMTTSRPGRASRPSEPPGNGNSHTSPPGNGG